MTAIRFYRIAHMLYRHHIPVLPTIIYRLSYFVNNCHIHYSTEIGAGTRLAYGGIGVVIGKDAVIGCDCVIESDVTIGGRNNIPAMPVIGDRVFIGTGAKILGDICIGNNSIIGANAVVLHSVPDNCSVAGVPAKILHKDIEIDKKCNIKEITQRCSKR